MKVRYEVEIKTEHEEVMDLQGQKNNKEMSSEAMIYCKQRSTI